MKSFAFVLLCVLAAVQGRSTGVNVAHKRTVAVAGENPWVVHLRVADGFTGLLRTCTGSLIDASWILTSADCPDSATFIWVRFGTIEVIRPELVLETSAIRFHQHWNQYTGENNMALITLNREVEFTQTIAAISLPAKNSRLPEAANFCAYGENEDNTPGDKLSCWDVDIIQRLPNEFLTRSENAVSEFDSGAALVSDGVHIGVLGEAVFSEGISVFMRTSSYVDWIESETGISARGAGAAEPDAVIVIDN